MLSNACKYRSKKETKEKLYQSSSSVQDIIPSEYDLVL